MFGKKKNNLYFCKNKLDGKIINVFGIKHYLLKNKW